MGSIVRYIVHVLQLVNKADIYLLSNLLSYKWQTVKEQLMNNVNSITLQMIYMLYSIFIYLIVVQSHFKVLKKEVLLFFSFAFKACILFDCIVSKRVKW